MLDSWDNKLFESSLGPIIDPCGTPGYCRLRSLIPEITPMAALVQVSHPVHRGQIIGSIGRWWKVEITNYFESSFGPMIDPCGTPGYCRLRSLIPEITPMAALVQVSHPVHRGQIIGSIGRWWKVEITNYFESSFGPMIDPCGTPGYCRLLLFNTRNNLNGISSSSSSSGSYYLV